MYLTDIKNLIAHLYEPKFLTNKFIRDKVITATSFL